MKPNVFFEMELILLVIFSVVIPTGIYLFLYRKIAISRWTVVAFALLLIGIAGIDVALLQILSEKVKALPSLAHHWVFLGQLSLVLYLLPATFAGLGINLLSHVLISHLNQSERQFDLDSRAGAPEGEPTGARVRGFVQSLERMSETRILVLCVAVDAALFALDTLSSDDIRLHILYVFPLAMVARYCTSLGVVFVIVAMTWVLQIVTFSLRVGSLTSFVTDVVISLSASLLIIFLARQGRLAALAASSPGRLP